MLGRTERELRQLLVECAAYLQLHICDSYCSFLAGPACRKTSAAPEKNKNRTTTKRTSANFDEITAALLSFGNSISIGSAVPPPRVAVTLFEVYIIIDS